MLNIKTYLTFIKLELDKNTDQTVAQLYLDLLYLTIIYNRSIYFRQLLITLKIFEKHYIKLLENNIPKLIVKLVYITIL